MMFWLLYADPDDYAAVLRTIKLDSVNVSARLMIPIIDDNLCEPDERFEITLTSLNVDCAVTSSPVPVYIIDNDGELLANNYLHIV